MSAKKKAERTKSSGSDAPTCSPSDTDWKAIAMDLASEVNFAIQYLAPRDGGSGMVMTKDNELRHWKEVAADKLELIPGVKIDREAMHACGLPRKQRHKFFSERAKKESSESEVTWCREKIFDDDIEYVHAGEIRRALMGHRCSQLWGDNGLIAATMRCVEAIGKIEDLVTTDHESKEGFIQRVRGILGR